MKFNQMGRFTIDQKLIREDPRQVADHLYGVVIVHAEAMFHDSRIYYIGICHEFEEVEDGSIVPEYELVVQRGEYPAGSLPQWRKKQ